MQPIQHPNQESQNLRDKLEQLQKENGQLRLQVEQLKQAELSARNEIQQLDLALRGSTIGEWEFDVQTRTYIISQRRAGMVGFVLKDVGTHFSMDVWPRWVHRDDIGDVLQLINDTIATSPESIESRHRLLNVDGNWRWTLNRGVCAERDPDGKALRYVGITMDIDEEVRTQKQLVELQLEHQRAKILAHFITQASHEFRTPLSIMSTNLYLLDKKDDEDVRQKHIDLINKQITYLESLIENLTAMAELDSIEKLETEQLDLSRITQEVLAKRADALQEKGINVVSEFSPKPLVMTGHVTRLYQLIDCLLDNAIRFSAENSTITITAELIPDTVVFKIVDNGVGIEAKHLAHVLKRFYRADQAGTTRGFGLGLPMAKRIIDLHRGQIEIDSQPGEGTTVRVRFPA